MAPIHANLPVTGFGTFGNVIERTYCLESGLLASPLCTQTAVGWYKMSNEPPMCELHNPKPSEEDELSLHFPAVEEFDYWSWLAGGHSGADE